MTSRSKAKRPTGSKRSLLSTRRSLMGGGLCESLCGPLYLSKSKGQIRKRNIIKQITYIVCRLMCRKEYSRPKLVNEIEASTLPEKFSIRELEEVNAYYKSLIRYNKKYLPDLSESARARHIMSLRESTMIIDSIIRYKQSNNHHSNRFSSSLKSSPRFPIS